MTYDKKTRSWFRREMTGKSAFAQWLDIIFSGAFVMFACYVWFLSKLQNQILAFILAVLASGIFLAAFSIGRSMKLDVFIRQYSAQLHSHALLEFLLMMPHDQLCSMVKTYHNFPEDACIELEGAFRNRTTMYTVIQRHPEEPYTATQLLPLYHLAQSQGCTSLHIYGTSPASAHAQSIIKRFDLQVTLHEPNELIAIAEAAKMLPAEVAVKAAIEDSIAIRRRSKDQIIKGRWLPANSKRYLFAAGVIFFASFVTGYRPYYNMIAAFCICMALITWYLGQSRKKDSPSSGTTTSHQ